MMPQRTLTTGAMARAENVLSATANSLTEITRRDIRRALTRESISWTGDLGETEFLNRLYDLSSMPSTDSRFPNAESDIWQHRINNDDWDDQWVFSDDRFQLADGPDEVYLNFLAEIVHPAVRADREQAKMIVAMLNELLAPDGWALSRNRPFPGGRFTAPSVSRLRNMRSTRRSLSHKSSMLITSTGRSTA